MNHLERKIREALKKERRPIEPRAVYLIEENDEDGAFAVITIVVKKEEQNRTYETASDAIFADRVFARESGIDIYIEVTDKTATETMEAITQC